MRRMILLIAILLVFVLPLSACVEKPKDTTGSTVGSTTGSPTTEATTGAHNEDPVLPTKGQDAQVDLNAVKEFEELIKNNQWYRRALGCIFEKPEDIPAWFYFYGGVDDYEQAKDEELAFIVAAFKKQNPNSDESYAHNYIRLPVAKINEALSVLGVTVKDIQIPDRWVYYDKTDTYYFWVSDAYGVEGWYVTKVEKGIDGTAAVYWETKGNYYGDPTVEKPSKGAKMVMTMQQQVDSTYRILSNVPRE